MLASLAGDVGKIHHWAQVVRDQHPDALEAFTGAGEIAKVQQEGADAQQRFGIIAATVNDLPAIHQEIVKARLRRQMLCLAGAVGKDGAAESFITLSSLFQFKS